jgi:CRISPR-associated protein Cmr4
MYDRRYGLIRTLAPLHVGSSEGEESGNLNLIFRDPFTQTGIIPGSSIRGRFRNECQSTEATTANSDIWYGNSFGAITTDQTTGKKKAFIKEGSVKFEYASLVWLPVFCPGQPIVWVSCPRLLRRYAACAKPSLKGIKLQEELPKRYTCSKMKSEDRAGEKKRLFFNLGFIELDIVDNLQNWMPSGFDHSLQASNRLVIVDDADIGMIHDMALYRQSRVKLDDDQKIVKNFFNVEALPEGSILVFPVATKSQPEIPAWKPFGEDRGRELYFGGLESVGFGRCQVLIPSATP